MWNMDLILSKLYFQGLWLRVSFEINVSSSTLLYRKLDRLKYFELQKSIFNIESLKTNTHATVFCLLGECFQIFPTIFFNFSVSICDFGWHNNIWCSCTCTTCGHARLFRSSPRQSENVLSMWTTKKEENYKDWIHLKFANWAYSWPTYDEK